MAQDKFSAIWVSHTSLNDFVTCPRAYYLKNVYKDPKTKHKIQIMSAPLALGQAVHEVLESRSKLATADRMRQPLLEQYEQVWKQVSGRKGGFVSQDQEQTYKERGAAMLRLVQADPGPLPRLSVKIKQDLPHFWLSPEENIILCGKVDWLEYLPVEDGVNIVDFKTGKNKESDNSLQLPIYHLLVHYCQKWKVISASYWYLESNEWLSKELPDLEDAHEQVLNLAKKVKTARKLEIFNCPQGDKGCYSCRPFEQVLAGDAEFVGLNQYNQDIYVLPTVSSESEEIESELL